MKQPQQQIDRSILVTDQRADAGDVVLRQHVVGIDGQRPCRPFLGAIYLAECREPHRTEISRSGILGMQREFAFSSRHAFARRRLHRIEVA